MAAPFPEFRNDGEFTRKASCGKTAFGCTSHGQPAQDEKLGIIMSHITFDTLQFSEQELVTKKDLQVELAPVKVMLGVVMGGIVALIMKAFF